MANSGVSVAAVAPAPAAEQLARATALAEALAAVEGPNLDVALTLLTTLLTSRPFWPAAQHAALVHLIADLDGRREAAQLAADPARRAGIGRAAAHFARKAQSGFSGALLP